jgi:uncharacterized protein
MGLRRYGRYLVRRIERLSSDPHAVAAGVAAGAAASMFPLIGFHFVIGFVIAFLTRGSMLAAAIGTVVGNPVTFPFIFSAAYQVGRWMPFGHQREAEALMRGSDIEDIMGSMVSEGISEVWPVWKTMMLGSIPLSIAAYLVAYVFVRWLVARAQARKAAKRSRAMGMSDG